MKIKLRTTYAGPKGTHLAGVVIEMEQDEAQALIDAGYAEVVDKPKPAPVSDPITIGDQLPVTDEPAPKRRGYRKRAGQG